MATDAEGGPLQQETLERGGLVAFESCPFPLPDADERAFLFEQEVAGRLHKNVSYDPQTGTTSGFRFRSAEQAARLQGIFADFSNRATTWLAHRLPGYAQCWQLDRVSFRPDEEATRRLRQKARNDLLHIDAFPSRPTQGWRILRLYVNLHCTEPRVWVTSDVFATLLARFGEKAALPSLRKTGWTGRLRARFVELFQSARRQRTDYDRFMLRFHDFLKASDEVQERGPKRYWTFAPGSAWLLFSDTLSHADLRGRYALDHSYFVAPQSLVLPGESPAALLEKMCGTRVVQRAA